LLAALADGTPLLNHKSKEALMATTTTPDTGELRLALDDILVGDNVATSTRSTSGTSRSRSRCAACSSR